MKNMKQLLCLAATALCVSVASGEDKKIVVGFSQIGAESGWRTANTDSIKSEAAKRGIAFETGIARFRETSRGHIMGVESGILKLVCCRDSRRLLGVHIIGEGATELVHIGQAVINLGGTIDYFVENSFNYPTLAEAYKVAGLDAWNRLRNAAGEVVKLGAARPKRKAS